MPPPIPKHRTLENIQSSIRLASIRFHFDTTKEPTALYLGIRERRLLSAIIENQHERWLREAEPGEPKRLKWEGKLVFTVDETEYLAVGI